MTDASTFGGGLATPIGGGTGGGADVPSPPGAPLSLAPPDPGTLPPATAPQPSALHSFGQGLNTLLNGPSYTPPDPQATALDQTADTLQQRIQRANSIATNPILQFFNPEGVQKARDFVPKATEDLQKIKQQQQQQADIQKAATNFGVPKSAQNPMMTNDTIDNYLLDQYKSGDFTAAKSLQARGKGEWVQDFAAAALDGAGAKLKAADTAATKLSAANGNQAAYNAARKSLTPEDIKALSDMGMQNIPDKATEWQGVVAKHGAMFQQAQQLHAQTVQKLTNMTNFDQSAPKEVGESIAANVTLGNTNEPAFGGNNVKIRTMDGQPGVTAPNGSVQTTRYGLSSKDGGWNAWNPEREKTFQSYTNDENVKGSLNQYNMMNKVRDTLTNEDNYRSSAGLTAIKDELGTMRDVAEKSAASGSIGFTKMFGMSQGVVETTLNKAANEWGALQNWLASGKKADAPGAPRMERDTIAGLKQLSQHMYDYAATEAKGRLGGAMTYAGRGGKPLDEIPLDAALKAELAPFHEQGRIEAINGYNAHPSLVTGNQRVFFPQGSNVQGATPPRPPVQQDTQATPPAAQAPQQGTPPAPQPGPAGGAAPPAPVTVAGQSITPNLPPGVSPNYLPNMQRVETGNEKSPWTATTPGSSASGAFQMIDSTWAANKPPGAPARAKDATPAQQVQANDKFMAGNAAALKGAGLPVNDNTMYVAHNLGTGGAAALLRAAPDADARTVVGEDAARNNPKFFKGKPTVATVLARYQAEMAPKADAPGAPSPPISGPNVAGQTGAGSFTTGRTDQPGETDIVQKGVEGAPMIGGIAGSLTGGPVGGAAGGGAGQALQNYMRGEDVLQPNVIGSAAFGAAGGIETAGLKGVALRTGTAAAGGGVEGGLEGGAAGAVEGGLKGAVGAAVGEGGARSIAGLANLTDRFGGFLGMGGHQTFSRLTPEAQTAYLDAAKTVAEGKPEAPAAMPGGGKNEVAVKAYEEKLADYEDAERHLKSVLPHVKPEEAAYAAQQVQGEPATKGEAVTGRPLAAEKANVARGYDELRSDVAQRGDELGIAKVKPSGVLPDGPLSNLRTTDNPSGKISDKYAKEMQDAEMLASAPAPNAETRWGNLQKARGELLEQERTAMAGPSPDTNRAKAMRQGADALRPEIQRTFEALFGKEGAKTAMQRLDTLDTRYARVMKLSGDGDIAGSIAKGGKAGRETNQAYKALTMGDTSAQRIMNALVSLRKGVPWQEVGLMVPVIAGEIASGSGHALSGALATAKLSKLLHDYVVKRGAGQPVTMDALIQKSRTPAVNPAVGGRAGAVAGADQARDGIEALNPISSASAAEAPNSRPAVRPRDGFGSTLGVGDYPMPRAGRLSDYKVKGKDK